MAVRVIVAGNGFAPEADQLQTLSEHGYLPKPAEIKAVPAKPWRTRDEAKGLAQALAAAAHSQLGATGRPVVRIVSQKGKEYLILRFQPDDAQPVSAGQDQQHAAAGGEARRDLIRFCCVECAKGIGATADLAGKEIACPSCGCRVRVPQAQAVAPLTSSPGRGGQLQKRLQGETDTKARQLVAAGQPNLDRLATDKKYRDRMMNHAMELANLAQRCLELAGEHGAAKAIKDSKDGIVVLVGGWDQFSAKTSGLYKTYLTMALIAYYGILIHVVNTFGLGELGTLDHFSQTEMVGCVCQIAQELTKIMDQIQAVQPELKGWRMLLRLR